MATPRQMISAMKSLVERVKKGDDCEEASLTQMRATMALLMTQDPPKQVVVSMAEHLIWLLKMESERISEGN